MLFKQSSIPEILEKTITICDSRIKGSISSYEVVLSLQLYAVMLDTSYTQFPTRKILKLPSRILPFLISTDEPQFLSACDVLHSLFQSLQLYPNNDLITSLCDKFMDLFKPFLSEFLSDLPSSGQSSQYLRIQLNDPDGRDCVARGCFRTLNLLIEFFKDSMRKYSKQLVRLVMCCISYREPTVQSDVLCLFSRLFRSLDLLLLITRIDSEQFSTLWDPPFLVTCRMPVLVSHICPKCTSKYALILFGVLARSYPVQSFGFVNGVIPLIEELIRAETWKPSWKPSWLLRNSGNSFGSSALLCLLIMLPSFPSLLSFLHHHLSSLLSLPFDSLLADLLYTANSLQNSPDFSELLLVKTADGLRTPLYPLSRAFLSETVRNYVSTHAINRDCWCSLCVQWRASTVETRRSVSSRKSRSRTRFKCSWCHPSKIGGSHGR